MGAAFIFKLLVEEIGVAGMSWNVLTVNPTRQCSSARYGTLGIIKADGDHEIGRNEDTIVITVGTGHAAIRE